MTNILIISLEELRTLENGYVVNCNINGIKTKIVCADDFKEAITILDLEENKWKPKESKEWQKNKD